MSAFLGPIHYWLFNKIEVSEKLFEDIIDFADKSGFESSTLEKEAIEKFGKKVTGKLEDNIDTDNIHGWLQGRIQSVESRLAYVTTELLKENKITESDYLEVFANNAKDIGEKLSINQIKAEELYNLIFNYLLSGMPCDRVNTVTESNDDCLVWIEEIDIHEQYWRGVNGDVALFHKAIEKWIETFVSSSKSRFVYEKIGEDNKIERI